MEMSGALFDVEHYYGQVTPAANGAYLQNITAPRHAWYIEDQRYGQIDVINGVLHRDDALIKTGLHMFDFGLDREAPDGSFPGSFGLFHGTAMFLAEAGPAMIILKHWDQLPSMGGAMLRHIQWEQSEMGKAARYLVRTWWHRSGHIDDPSKEDRFFEGAIALESVGVLTDDSGMEARAATYASEGLRMTRPNGVMPENDGHDSSYQALGLIYATRFLELTGPGALYRALYQKVSLGESWLLSRVNGNGTINRSGDSRTGPSCPERSGSGACKTDNPTAVYGALMRWGVIRNDGRFRNAAHQVWFQYTR